jgi:lysophospholipase L1-like esterase
VRPWAAAAATLAALGIVACGGSSTASTTAPGTTSTASASSATTQSGARSDLLTPVAGQPPQDGVPWYLAIGDSVTFGFTRDPARIGVNSSWALQLEKMLAGAGKSWKLYDVACPGETTASYFGHCSGSGLVPFLATQSQHDAALSAIRAHGRDLKLILVDLGSNDLLRASRDARGAAAAAAELRVNLQRILAELQSAAPSVPVVLANYYDPLANGAPETVAQITLVNGALQQLARDLRVLYADFFAVINKPTAPDPDLAAYIDLAHGDIHPTVLGHTRLAQAALKVIP